MSSGQRSDLLCYKRSVLLRARDPTLAPALYTAGVMGAVLPPPPATQCKTSKNRCRPGECKGSLSFETPNFDFAQSLHTSFLYYYPLTFMQKISKFVGFFLELYGSVHFWAIFDPKLPRKPQF